jgi:hypothetical protein
MAFDIKGYRRGPQLGTDANGVNYYRHTYVTADADTTVVAASYFDNLAVRGLVKKGELIEVMTAIGGTPKYRLYNITAVANSGLSTGTVTVTAVTGASLT